MVKKCSRGRSYGFTVLLLLAAWVPAIAQHTSDGLGGGAFNIAACENPLSFPIASFSNSGSTFIDLSRQPEHWIRALSQEW